MNYFQMPAADVRPGDHPLMIEAIRMLKTEGIDVRRPDNSPHQLKVDEATSFYPTTGRIVVDGAPKAQPQRGLKALLAFLEA